MKAYDTVRWDFMVEVLKTFGFPERMVGWIRECMTTTMFSISINGELNGFFHGGRGLRQGDPVSPYLFVLAMEVLSGLLSKMVLERGFQFHWRCSKSRLTHLCFADDLMIFCKAEEISITMIRDCLQQFMILSGLVPNPSKSHLFSSGISSACKQRLLNLLGFQEGVLPVRYLGVPLISSKLRASDCNVLVERIIGRAKSWCCKTLSYAGRLQLIKSVLFSIQVYWSSLFILPKIIIRRVEASLRSFLWRGSELLSTGAKVAWDRVCLPKEEGGLGIKKLEQWNKAAIMKHLWFLCSCQTSCWSNWVHTYLLRGKSFWEVPCPGDCSWSWRKILSLRSWVRRRMRFQIGNGEKTLLWFDNWHPLGPIVDTMGERVIYDSGLDRMARVAAIIDGSSWSWPSAKSASLLHLAHSLPSDYIPCSTKEDELVWEDDPKGVFSIRRAWESLRPIGPRVSWYRIVWFRKAIPRQAFLLWLVIQGGLYTQDRLMTFGISGCSQCVLCSNSGEDIDHLFFHCPFSTQILSFVLAKCGLDWSTRGWLQTLKWMEQFCDDSLCHLLVRLSFAAVIYFIWGERNARLHDEPPRPYSSILSSVVFSVRTRASLLRKVKPSYDNKWLHLSWHLSDDIF